MEFLHTHVNNVITTQQTTATRTVTATATATTTTTSRNISSSSSAFVSASQTPFFSPRSPASVDSSTLQSDRLLQRQSSLSNLRFSSVDQRPTFPEDFSAEGDGSSSECSQKCSQKKKKKKNGRGGQGKFSFARGSTLLSSTRRPRTCDVYIGFHGRKPSLLRFTNWLRAELESHGISCFAADRARCRSSHSHDTVTRAMNACSFGVVILSKKSFANPFSMEEVVNFLKRKNLIPIFFDLAASDCIARDIVERRGELWERHGGELWVLYGGIEKEWMDAVDGVMRIDDWMIEANDGNWRDCISNAVILIATRLGRRSAVERVNRWRDRVDKDEFPFVRCETFVGRKKELSELELLLFGDVTGDGEREFFELKPRHRRKSLVIRRNKMPHGHCDADADGDVRGKDPVIWRESENEIEMQNIETSPPPSQFRRPRTSNVLSISGGCRKKEAFKMLYGKGIACVSGESGIGKTELALEYAYRFHQRYKMVLWVSGETRYIRQNYLNMRSFLDVDVSIENHCLKNGNARSFEKQEASAISRLRKELMRDIPFLVVIDNLENEKDWWDRKTLMDLLPRFGGETHFIITTRLPRVLNLEPLQLSFLSGMEAITLMKGNSRDYPVAEIDAVRIIEERLGRLTLGLGIVGAILAELPINPTRLLDTVTRMPAKDLSFYDESEIPPPTVFLMQLLEVCFSIFDHADDGSKSLATKMVQVSGWFAPAPIPIPLLASAASKIPNKSHRSKLWSNLLHLSHMKKKSSSEASSMLVRFGIARATNTPDCIHFHELIKLYARKKGTSKVAQAMVTAVSHHRDSIVKHPEHLWAASFLLFGFGSDPIVVEPSPTELLYLIKQVAVPLAIHTFITFSRCNAALELLRLCTDTLEISAESLLSPAEKWYDKTLCCCCPRRRSVQTDSKHTNLWQELALLKANVLETRTKLLIRGGQYDVGDDLIRKSIFIRTSISGEHHPDTVAARETLSKLTRLRANIQFS